MTPKNKESITTVARKYYLAGPMAGLTNNNLEAFEEYSNALRARHYDIVSPHEIDPGVPDPGWEDYLRADIRHGLLICNAMILMPGWTRSRGVALELEIASKLEYHIYHVNPEYELRLSRYGNQDETVFGRLVTA